MMLLEFGRRRRGKSTLAMHIARLQKKNTIIFDPNNQFWNGTLVYESEQIRQLIEREDDVPNVIIYRLTSEPWESFDDFAKSIWGLGGYNLIIDEAHRLQKPNRVHPWLDTFIRQSPTDEDEPYTVHIIQTMHRPQDCNGITFSQATHLVFFRFTKERDLEVVENEAGTSVADAVRSLRDRQFILYNVDDEVFDLVSNDKEWYEPIRTREAIENATDTTESIFPMV